MPTERENVLFVDRSGYDFYRLPTGEPALDPERYRVTLVTPNNFGGQAQHGECAEVLCLDVNDHALLGTLIEALHQRRRFDHILAFSEGLLLPMAALRERLGVPGPRQEEILPYRDKSIMKATARRAGLLVADWLPVDRAADARDLLATHGTIVIKPRAGFGSAGVHIVSAADELRTLDDDPALDLTNHQAEQFIDAPMVHVDAVIVGGKPHTVVPSRYLTSTLSFTQGLPLLSTTVDEPHLVAACETLLAQVVAAFGVTDHVLHLEAFVLEDDRLVFSEVACRPGGGNLQALVAAVSGVSLHEAMVRLYLGEAPATTYPVLGPAAGNVTFYGRPGLVTAVEDQAVPPEWIVERRLLTAPDGRFHPVGMVGGGLVDYILIGGSTEEVSHRLRFTAEHVTIGYEDGNDV
jgi:ATP-grasp N-terminal domain